MPRPEAAPVEDRIRMLPGRVRVTEIDDNVADEPVDDPADIPTMPTPAAGPFPAPPGELAPPFSSARLFGSPSFFRLWLAQVVSSLGDWVGIVAITALAAHVGKKSPEAAISLV